MQAPASSSPTETHRSCFLCCWTWQPAAYLQSLVFSQPFRLSSCCFFATNPLTASLLTCHQADTSCLSSPVIGLCLCCADSSRPHLPGDLLIRSGLCLPQDASSFADTAQTTHTMRHGRVRLSAFHLHFKQHQPAPSQDLPLWPSPLQRSPHSSRPLPLPSPGNPLGSSSQWPRHSCTLLGILHFLPLSWDQHHRFLLGTAYSHCLQL